MDVDVDVDAVAYADAGGRRRRRRDECLCYTLAGTGKGANIKHNIKQELACDINKIQIYFILLLLSLMRYLQVVKQRMVRIIYTAGLRCSPA